MLATSPPAVDISNAVTDEILIKNAHGGNPYLCRTLNMAGMNLSSSICGSTAIYRVLLRLSLSLSVCASSPMIKPCLYIHIYPELFVHHSSFIIPPCVSGCLSFIMHPLSSDLVVKSLATRLHQLAYPYSSIFHWSSTVQLPFFGEHP